jgi:glycosyltransferase involved in cell wall biosynthesis
MPKISIITVCFNAEKYIEQTIKSVLDQKNGDIEYIVIDGASTDKTLNIIRQYDSKITKWISEPDNGIADAMNKGIKLATGAYLLFLHADDYLFGSRVNDSKKGGNIDLYIIPGQKSSVKQLYKKLIF